MVVLEEGSMLTTGPNQYLQPDYLSPLPTTLDAKKSPLALLAQTCSQIGADSPSKPLISSLDKSSKGTTASSARSPPAAKLSRSSPSDGSKSNSMSSTSSSSLAFKPYETNVVSKSRVVEESRPASKASSVHSASGGHDSSASASDDTNNNTHHSKKSSHRSTPIGRKSASPAQTHSPCNNSSKSPSVEQRKTPSTNQDREKSSASPKNSSGASPIIRSGMEILSGHKDAAAASMYKPGLPFGAGALCCPPGMTENPAFRPPFAGASPFSHHHAAAAALLGYPGANNPYLSYARVKTPSGGETLVPVCKDPFCTGCQYSVHNLMSAPTAQACPSGCTQCDHQKYGLMGLSSLGPMPPPSLAGYPSPIPTPAAAAAAAGKPHVCSWIAGESYCGKRFATSDELLQHLRSHTSLGAEALHPLLSPRGYPAPSLSPLSARYHPYGKPPTGPLPASLAASPYSAFNALGPYYSPYAIYGQRLGAAVHP